MHISLWQVHLHTKLRGDPPQIAGHTYSSSITYTPVKIGLEGQAREKGVLPVGPGGVSPPGGLRVHLEQSLQRVQLAGLAQPLLLFLLRRLRGGGCRKVCVCSAGTPGGRSGCRAIQDTYQTIGYVYERCLDELVWSAAEKEACVSHLSAEPKLPTSTFRRRSCNQQQGRGDTARHDTTRQQRRCRLDSGVHRLTYVVFM